MEGVALNCKGCIFTWLYLNPSTVHTATLLYRKVLLTFMEVLRGNFFHEFKDSLMQTFSCSYWVSEAEVSVISAGKESWVVFVGLCGTGC